MEFKGEWLAADKDRFKSDMRVLVDFITEEEESKLLEEIEPYMKRLRYEFDHWDDVSSISQNLISVYSFFIFIVALTEV